MKQWANDLVKLASAMPTSPDPGFNESLNLLRLVHNGQWSELTSLDWSALDQATVFSLAVNVLKPEALLSTPFDWLTPLKEAEISPLAALLTPKSLRSFVAKNDDSEYSRVDYSRADYVARRFWENTAVQQQFPATTQVVFEGKTYALGNLALEWNAPSAETFLKRSWSTSDEQVETWRAFFKMVCNIPLPSFSVRPSTNVFEHADHIFDLLPSTNPFGLEPAQGSLLPLAFRAIVSVADHKLEAQNLNRKIADRQSMAIEMEEFTMHVCAYIAQTVQQDPQRWNTLFNANNLERNPLAIRVVLGMLFQNMDSSARQHAVDALIEKVVDSQDIIWAKLLPTHPDIVVALTDGQIKSVLDVCMDPHKMSWACKTLMPLASPDGRAKLEQIHTLNEDKTQKQRNALEITALVENFAHTNQPKIRKM